MKILNVGVIGYGLRASGVFELIYKLRDDITIRLAAVCDPKPRADIEKRLDMQGIEHGTTVFYTEADEMLEKEKLDGVIIGTRCSLHAALAEKVLKKRIPLFLEKPIAITYESWNSLRSVYERLGGEVVVSFPLRLTALVSEAKAIIKNEGLGPIRHIAAFNYVTYGGDYYHEWYRDESETGGLFLQKATHDFDYITYIAEDEIPAEICAMKSKLVMKGDKPAGLKCADCGEKLTCREGPFQTVNTLGDFVHGPYCCFAKDTGNEDSGTAIIRFESGMHMVYTQNFFVRNKNAAKRGAVFAAEGGTVEFDWHTSDIWVRKNYIPGEIKYHVETAGRHGGGDLKLAMNFIGVMLGTEKSKTPLEDGLMSSYLCLKARESAENARFLKINYRKGRNYESDSMDGEPS